MGAATDTFYMFEDTRIGSAASSARLELSERESQVLGHEMSDWGRFVLCVHVVGVWTTF